MPSRLNKFKSEKTSLKKICDVVQTKKFDTQALRVTSFEIFCITLKTVWHTKVSMWYRKANRKNNAHFAIKRQYIAFIIFGY